MDFGKARAALRSKPARIASAVTLFAIGLACLLSTETVGHVTGFDALVVKSEGLVDANLDRNLTTFLTISGIKAAMALIEGSSVGVGFSLQLGDVIQPAYDYVHFFWKIFLYAFVILGIYKLVLETGMLSLGISIFGVGALLIGVGLLTPKSEKTFNNFGRRFLLIGILAAYIVPLSLILTQFLSDRYTVAFEAKQLEQIETFNAELDKAKSDFVAIRERISLLSPGESLAEMRAGLLAIAGSVTESFRQCLMAFLYFVLLLLFDLLFFPMLSAFVLYKFAQFAIDRALERTAAPLIIQPEPSPETGAA